MISTPADTKFTTKNFVWQYPIVVSTMEDEELSMETSWLFSETLKILVGRSRKPIAKLSLARSTAVDLNLDLSVHGKQNKPGRTISPPYFGAGIY